MSLRFRPALALLFSVAFLLAAVPASADGGRKHHRHHHKHHQKAWKHHWKHHGGHGGHRHHHGCGHRGYFAPAVVQYHSYGYPVYHHTPAFYCGPCSHYFDSYDHLSHHVHRHHHVAVLELPRVILQASIGGGVGWVFGH